jgi:hypothetical protein
MRYRLYDLHAAAYKLQLAGLHPEAVMLEAYARLLQAVDHTLAASEKVGGDLPIELAAALDALRVQKES